MANEEKKMILKRDLKSLPYLFLENYVKHKRLKYSVGPRFCSKISIWSSYFY